MRVPQPCPQRLFADFQVDPPQILTCGVAAEDTLQVHLLQPAVPDRPTIDFHNEHKRRLRDAAVNMLHLLE